MSRATNGHARRRVCVVVHSRANYGRVKSVMRAIQDHPDLELVVVVGASALLSRAGNAVSVIERDGFPITARVPFVVEGDTPTTMAKSTGLGIIELATQFDNLRPDVVVTVADRFETMATAIAAAYMNITLAHIQGGEVTGSIDESVRHAVTRLAHLHFPATERAAEYLVRMGEPADRVHLVGCPSIDVIADLDLSTRGDLFDRYRGVGNPPRMDEPYVVVLQHPVTTEYGDGHRQIGETLKAVRTLGHRTVWLWPNIDAGTDDISKGLRQFRELDHAGAERCVFYKNFAVEDYARLIKNSACLLGNTSSAIREGSFLGVPAVTIGSRQNWREHANNVLMVDYDADAIVAATRRQIAHGPFPRSTMFGDGRAGARIADRIAGAELERQKLLAYPLLDSGASGTQRKLSAAQ